MRAALTVVPEVVIEVQLRPKRGTELLVEDVLQRAFLFCDLLFFAHSSFILFIKLTFDIKRVRFQELGISNSKLKKRSLKRNLGF